MGLFSAIGGLFAGAGERNARIAAYRTEVLSTLGNDEIKAGLQTNRWKGDEFVAAMKEAMARGIELKDDDGEDY